MDNLVNETNTRLQEIIDNLTTIKEEYEKKLNTNSKEIDNELDQVKQYKEEFFTSKQKIEKMNSDIEGFEQDYQNLVDRFKDDELANILIAANKEISSKIEERKRKILNDKAAMNNLVEKAEVVKKKLVKLTAEKKALELCFEKINDAYEYYTKVLGEIIEYSTINRGNLSQKKSTNKTKDIKLDDEEFSIDSIKDEDEDKYIIEEANEDEKVIDENDQIEFEDKDDDIEITLEEIEIEDKDDKIKETEEIDDINEKVNDVNEIPTSIFNFDDSIGYDDEIEDDE